MVIKSLLPLSIIIFPLFAEAKDNLELSAEVEVGYGYDSNVSVDDVDLNTNIGDQFIDLRFSSDLVFKIQESTKMSAGLTVSDRLYDTFDEFDGLLSLASLAVSHQKGDWEYGFITRYIDYQLDGSELLAMTQISPSLAWFPSKRTYLYLNYERSIEAYRENSQRNNDRDEVGAAFYYFIKGLRQYITIQADVAKEKAKTSFFGTRFYVLFSKTTSDTGKVHIIMIVWVLNGPKYQPNPWTYFLLQILAFCSKTAPKKR